MKIITEKDNQTIEPPLEEEYERETLDPEPTMYIRELMEDWNRINLIEKNFKNTRNSEINNKTSRGEIIIQTKLKNKNTINWLADKRSPRSFIDIQTAKELIQKEKKKEIRRIRWVYEIQNASTTKIYQS